MSERREHKNERDERDKRKIFIFEIFFLEQQKKKTSTQSEKDYPTSQNPELVERLKIIQANLEQKEYNRLVKNVTQVDKYNLHDDVREIREESKKITGVVNILFTIGGVFAAIFVLSSHVFTSVGWVSPFSFFDFSEN